MIKVLFDVTRIFVRGSRFSPTGIDRVVIAYAKWLLARRDVELQPVLTVGGRLLGFPRMALASMIEQSEAFARAASAESEESATWSALLGALNAAPGQAPTLRSGKIVRQLPARARWHLDLAGRSILHLRPLKPQANSVYVNVSHTGLGEPRVLGSLDARGIRSLVMVHDLIPIYFPEYCAPSSEARHIRRMDQIIAHARAVVTNSAATATEFRTYAETVGRHAPPTEAAPLGIEPAFFDPPSEPIAKSPYFVCLGTLEARKNLPYLLALWRRLAERMGPATPWLVLVGRRGWENEAVIDQLERSKAVNRFVHEVCDLNDRQLSHLVAGAAALLSPSLAEGYNLPVVEALAARTPVIASDIPVNRELAACATLLDAFDGPAWLAAIEDMALNPRRAPPYSAPTWAAHFEKLDKILADVAGP